GQEATSSNRIVSKRKIQELVESIDPSERLEAVVEDLLLELADEFIDSVTRFSCQLAKHRKSDRLETKDIQLHLERSWNIRIPGFANEEIRQSQSRRINALPSYQARVSAVREAAKKRRPAN
ncbi:transcription initiation factor TFIID subunit A-domain-containing protein, partial [Phakopsora pachyrhizi]